MFREAEFIVHRKESQFGCGKLIPLTTILQDISPVEANDAEFVAVEPALAVDAGTLMT